MDDLWDNLNGFKPLTEDTRKLLKSLVKKPKTYHSSHEAIEKSSENTQSSIKII